MLVKSADYFIEYAERLGFYLRIPHFIIGITIVGIGTSLPELATSLVSVLKSTPKNDLTEIVTGNVVGSNVANILLGAGIASLFWVIKVERELQDNDLPFLFGSTALTIFFLSDGVLSRGEGFILLLMFGVFLAFSVLDKSQRDDIREEEKREKKLMKGQDPWIMVAFLVVSGTGIIIASDLTIGSLIELSPALGISRDVASMVLLAIGTSFPEIFVSIMAMKKKNPSLAIGNILGSNISNSLGILGISGLIAPLSVSETTLFTGLPFLAIATLFFVFSALDNRFRVWEGCMAIAIFLAFLGGTFGIL